jgi:Rrf2 family protein
MAHLTASVEYAVHSLLWLALADGEPRSGPDLATFQGISPSFVAKILMKLKKAGIVRSVEGLRGGYQLARDPDTLSILEIVDAVEGRKPLFDCQEVRRNCVLFGSSPPKWATEGVCAVHVAMLKAEKAMRDSLASETLAEIAQTAGRKFPSSFTEPTKRWFDDRIVARTAARGSKASNPA